jgi:Protein of unknown function (DUF2510)
MNQPAGWCADPFNREQERYWDGKVWTAHVRPTGAAYDAPPPGLETAVPTGTTTHGQASAIPAGGASPAVTAWSPAAHALPASPPHRRAMVLSAIATAVLVVGGVGAYLVLGDHHSAAASEAIAKAVTQSLNEQTADMSLDVQISAAGMSEHVTGNGAFDFSARSGTITVNVPSGNEQITEQVIEDSSTVYVSIPSQFGQLLSGKSWVSVDASTFASGNDDGLGSGFNGIEDPAALLHQLQSQGDPVDSLGPTTYDSTSVSGYSVTIPLSQLEKDLGQLPADDRQLASGLLPSSITEKVYIDSNGLLRGVVVPISFSLAGHTLSETVQMSYSNYGTPVSVTAPPANEVVTLQQLEAAAGSSGGGGLGGLGTGNTGNTI